MSAIDRIRKRRELLEIQKSGGSQLDVSKKRIEQNRNELATTGKIDYGTPSVIPKMERISPVKSTSTNKTSKAKKDDTPWYKQIFTKGEFKDGVDGLGDALYKGVKTGLGTATDLTQDITKGLLNIAEAPLDIGTNLIASGTNRLGLKNTAENMRKFADKDLSENISRASANISPTGMVYNIVNGTPENIMNPSGVKWDKNKSLVKNYTSNFSKVFTGEVEDKQKAYEKSSISGKYIDKTSELVGYSLGLMYGGQALSGASGTASIGTKTIGASANAGNIGLNFAGKTLNIPTLALAGGMSGALQEANSKEGVTELERWSKALSGGLIEGATEGMFGMFGVGGITDDAGKEIFDVIGEKAAGLFKNSVAKTLANVGVKATGESIEELASYTANFFVDNGIIDKLGDADFSKKWDWAEVGEQMALAFVSAGITQGGGQVIQNNVAIKAAEDQLGRKLTKQEKAQVTQASIEGTMEEKSFSLTQENDTQETVTQVPQTNLTIEQIDNQIAVLESQLNENLSDEKYNEITDKIMELENQAELIEQNGPTTTQEVESNSLVDASSNTLETGNNVVQDANVMNNASNIQQDAQMQERPVNTELSPVKSGQVSEQQTTNVKQQTINLEQQKPVDTSYQGTNHSKAKAYGKGITADKMYQQFDKLADNSKSDTEVIDKLNQVKDNPEAKIKIYRATPGDNINSGDWVFLSQQKADDFSRALFSKQRKNGYKVLEMEVKAKDVDWTGKNLEFVYAPQSENNYKAKDITELTETPSQTQENESNSPAKEEAKPTTEKSESIFTSKEQYTEEEIREHGKRLQKASIENANERHPALTDEYIEEWVKTSIEYAKGSGKLAPTKSETTPKVQENLSPIKEATNDLKQAQKEVEEQVKELKETVEEFKALTKEQYQGLQEQLDKANSQEQTPPPEVEVFDDKLDTSALDDRTVNKITKDFARGMKLNKTQKAELNSAIKDLSSRGNVTTEDVLDVLYNYDEMSVRQRNEEIAEAKGDLKNINSLKINSTIANDVDMPKLRQLAKNNLKFKVDDMGNVDIYYEELSNKYPHLFPSDVITPSQQFEIMVDIASTPIYSYESLKVPHGTLTEEAQYMYDLMEDYKIDQKTKDADKDYKAWVKSLRGLEPTPEVSEFGPVEETKPNKEEFRKAVIESAKEVEKELGYIPKDPTRAESYEYDEEVAEILTSEPKTPKEQKNKIWAWIKANIFDRGMVFEDLAIKTKNRKLQAKWDFSLTSESRAQYIIGNGHVDENGNQTSKSLNDIMAEVNNTGLTKEFYDYVYHKHNVDRMSLESRAKAKAIELDKRSATITDMKEKAEIEAQLKELSKVANKPVFGNSVTSEVSQQRVNEYEMYHPEFIDFAQDVYDYVNADRAQLVKEGVISQETADLWQQMYPHYVPIRRAGHEGPAINVALDTNRTGINAPIKKATGGNSDILPLFDTMAQRTIQTQRATAKNSFGIELKNTLKANSIKNTTSVDEIIDSVDNQEGLLQEGKNGANPTFTVFQNGERVTYEITQEMYEALKPISDSSILSKTFKPTNIASNIHRGLLTQYNIFFALKNGVKDIQDVLINSQHSAKTYAKIPEAYAQLLGKGHWYNEYMRNGGEQNSYFDSQEMNFDTKHKGISKVLDLPPLKQIAQLNDFIERVPRLAEYIASRESGRSIEVSMLDAARVTTNFKAGGTATKWANRNGATFLNASVQGALQQVRNVREANMNGARGWVNLVTKFSMASLPAMLLNSLLWDDDEEYEELSDYVKQNYYIVGKYGDGQFYRIPKGRTVAVIQDAIEQISNAATGNDEVDLKNFLDLVVTNLSPSNPLENNIFAPIGQALSNKTWYGDDLVPQRLKDLPAEEQFDETTDSFSRWLGEKTNISPIKINYLLNQYSGVVGDVVMPMITPKATQEEGSTLLAPLKDIFTVDGIMKNQNVSDFYSTSEKLTTGAKSKNATDEDILKNKYISSVKTELNDLYKEKREIQSDEFLSKGEKYKQVKEIQKQINAITKDALEKYSDGNYTNNYGIIDDREYYKNKKGDWTAVDNKEKEALNELNLSLEEKSTYFNTLQELNDIADQYKGEDSDYSLDKKREVISTIQSTGLSEDVQARLYKKEYNTDDVDRVLITGIGLDNYFDYVQQDIKADKNSKGNSIPNSRKNKVVSYVNGYELNIAQKAILIKSTNTFKFNEYNNDIVEYISGLSLDFEEKRKILEDLKFKVYDNGTVEWEE